MAIYRAESGRRIAFIAVAAAIAGLVLGLAIGRVTAPGLRAQVDDVRAQAAPIASSLEVIRTEYAKLLAGAADPGGAEAAMTRIETAFAAVRPSLDALDPTGAALLFESINSLRSSVDGRDPEVNVAAKLDDVQARLDAVLPG